MARSLRTAWGVTALVIVLAAPHGETAASEPTLAQRTGAYVATFFTAIANIVAQEDLQLKEGRNVTSDLLLVRYPGSLLDLIVFRDVVSVDGTALPHHQEHLLDLFQSDFVSAIGRANQIMTDSQEHVPTILNPLYAMAFLQPHYQSRFKIDEHGAEIGWPRRTKTLTFTETTTPTLLRAGIMREIDVPTRGTAWVEQDTGTVLQTELQIRHPEGVTTIKTTFASDARLNLFLPATMETKKPEARARYGNFRRFIVLIDEAVRAAFR
jgi:hypothetical protein